jgi:hypothetical protein
VTKNWLESNHFCDTLPQVSRAVPDVTKNRLESNHFCDTLAPRGRRTSVIERSG